MKTIVFTFLISFVFITCKGQNNHLNHVTHDKVKFNNLFDYDTNPSMVKSKIGNPISIKSEYDEMQDTDAIVYEYDGLKIYFINNIIYDFVITKNTYSLFIDGLEVKVGDSINVIKNKFPKSYNERILNEGTGIVLSDWDSAIMFYLSNDVITKIENKIF